MFVRVVPKRSWEVVPVEFVLVGRLVFRAHVDEDVVTRRFSGDMGPVGVYVRCVRNGVVVMP